MSFIRCHRRQSIAAPGTARSRLSSSDRGFAFSPLVSATAICTGAKHGPTFLIVRACRRHVNTTLAAIPLRSATSVTFAPGANVSSTIHILSSCDHRRRRSAPPNTSTRIGDDLKATLKVTCFAESFHKTRRSSSDAYASVSARRTSLQRL